MVELFHGDAVACEHIAVRAYLYLRRLCLLFHVKIYESLDVGYLVFQSVCCHEQLADVGPENLYCDGGACPCEHVVDTVSEGLSHCGGDAGYGGETLTHICQELPLCALP